MSVYIPLLTMQMLRESPCFQENHKGLQLELQMREGTGSFFHRLLSREEATGYSSRIYYRAPALGRVPFNWETEPGKPKTAGCCYMEEEIADDDVILPLSPPPYLRAKNSRSFSSGKRGGEGLLHKIVCFLHRKTQTKAKLVRMIRCLTAEIQLSDAENVKDEKKINDDGGGIKNITSDSESEDEDDDNDLMLDFSSHTSFERFDTSSSSSSSSSTSSSGLVSSFS